MLSAKSGKQAMSNVRPDALLLISSPGSAYAEDNAGIEGEEVDQKRGETLGDRDNNKERMGKYCQYQQELRQHELILSQSNHTESAAVCSFVGNLSFVLQLQRNRRDSHWSPPFSATTAALAGISCVFFFCACFPPSVRQGACFPPSVRQKLDTSCSFGRLDVKERKHSHNTPASHINTHKYSAALHAQIRALSAPLGVRAMPTIHLGCWKFALDNRFFYVRAKQEISGSRGLVRSANLSVRAPFARS